MTPKNSFLRTALLLSISTAFALACGEAFVRVVLLGEFDRRVAEWDHPFYEILSNSPIEFRVRPHVDTIGAVRGTSERFAVRTNEHGFRGPPFHSAATPIAILGDSYTFGWAVQAGEEYPRIVEMQLRRRFPESDIRVYNMGVPAYGTIHHREQVKQAIRDFGAKVVVLAFVVNDVEPQQEILRSPRQIYRYNTSWMVAFVKERLNGVFGWSLDPGFNMPERYLEAFRERNSKFQEARAAYHEIVSECRGANVPIAMVVLPDTTQPLAGKYAYTEIHEEVMRWAREEGVAARDVLPAFIHQKGKTLRVRGDGHPNALAHRQIADIVSDLIVEVLPAK